MSKYLVKTGLVFLTTFFVALQSFAQSCCSGGVPISNNLGLPITSNKTLQFAFNYDLNILSTLKDGSNKLDDISRRRLTHSLLFQGGYIISKRWSAEFFLSWIKQERIINQFGNTDNTIAQGIGDAVVLLKYKAIFSNRKKVILLVGAGYKLPTGISDIKDKNRIALNADLQPGSGSVDLITWTQVLKNSKAHPTLTYSATATYSFKGKNNHYLGSQIYQFGNEMILIAGLANQFTAKNFLWGASLQATYRYALQDKNNGEKTPGTGGQWVFIRPGLTISPLQKLTVSLHASFPAYSWVRDTQLTPTIRFNTGFYVEINKVKPSRIK
ncbi:MAG: transporter [Chitinophagaceae bacterium]|nr:transporter [Chitinophagaceae bacterium]